jgi:nucleotide-binding universal stress UspA family protein
MSQEPEGRKVIVVGVDGSSEAASALDWSIDLARDLRAEVVAVHALDTAFIAYFSLELGTRLPLARWQEEMKRTFEDEWCAALKDSGIPYRTLLPEGRPAAALRETAERLGATMVVVGRQGRSRVTQLLLGSVSNELTQHCPVPVVVLSSKG